MDASDSPQDRSRPTLDQLVVERALVSREHLEFCLAYQRALRQGPAPQEKPLGEILFEKGLLKQEELRRLLEELEHWGEAKGVRPAPAAAMPPGAKPASEKPRRERRQRRGMEPEEPPPEGEAPKPRRGHLVEILVAAGLVVAVILAVKFWPSGGASRVLDAYLKSCGEDSKAPDGSLAIGDLGIVVRQFEMGAAEAPTWFDYGGELRAYGGRQGVVGWAEFVAVTGMEGPKHQALSLLLPGIPKNLKPKNVGSLSVTMQTIRCSVIYRSRDKKLFKKAEAQFILLQPVSPPWSPGWKVAAFQPEDGK